MPDAYGAGEFEATMNIFTDSTYREPYIDPPILNPDETIYVGKLFQDLKQVVVSKTKQKKRYSKTIFIVSHFKKTSQDPNQLLHGVNPYLTMIRKKSFPITEAVTEDGFSLF